MLHFVVIEARFIFTNLGSLRVGNFVSPPSFILHILLLRYISPI